MKQQGLKRDKKVFLNHVGGDKYDVLNHDKQVIFKANDNYFIYFKNVNLRTDGTIDGRYLGTLDDNSPLIDGYTRKVSYDGDGFKSDGKLVRTAKMVAVNSKSGAIIIIN